MTINVKLPENIILKPTITVFGVGGAGGNAVNNMIRSNLQGAKFVVANTDAQALEFSLAEHKLQLGVTTTRGLGAGASPEVGAAAANESEPDIKSMLEGSNMVFVTAGMGGGTGTGAAPTIAKIARDMGILTVGVVTKPFHFEGKYRMNLAEKGLEDMQKNVDTLIVIPNQNLFHIANEKTSFADAFKMADDVLHSGVRGITDLMIMPGLINLDFADIRTVMKEMGKAMMGTGEASGSEDRAIRAAEAAISNPLLDHRSVKGAKGVLINITGGVDMTLFEVDAAANKIREEVGDEARANIIFGSTYNKDLDGTIRVSVVATGIDSENFKDIFKHSPSPTIITSIIQTSQDSEVETTSADNFITEELQDSTIPPISANLDEAAPENQNPSQSLNSFERADELEEEPRIIAAIIPETIKKESTSSKQSIFTRLLSKVMPPAQTQTTPSSRLIPKGDKVEMINDSADIYDVPAFLRRK
ncbi:MAG: cell division protein FtsZ [Rickettsiaceae bacterium]|nr:cell division protein FtsZ [Rickettsiaceae bacterium]